MHSRDVPALRLGVLLVLSRSIFLFLEIFTNLFVLHSTRGCARLTARQELAVLPCLLPACPLQDNLARKCESCGVSSHG